MIAFEASDLLQAQARAGRPYHEFLRVETMSMGLYVLPAGGEDLQQPHAEDEVYYVLNGHGTVHVSGEDRPVVPGSIIFVGKEEVHNFHSITETLQLLVFFAPPESDL